MSFSPNSNNSISFTNDFLNPIPTFENPIQFENEDLNQSNLRQLWIGNLQPEVTVEDLGNVVRGGLIVRIKVLMEKHCAFITFAKASSALEFFTFANNFGVSVKNRRVKVGWGKPQPLSERVIEAIKRGATRNIYLGGINLSITEEKLREDFSEFGEIEQVHLIPSKNTGFVNFTSILNAVSAFERIQRNPTYAKFNVKFGKDRCSNPVRSSNSSSSSSPRHHTPSQSFVNLVQLGQNQTTSGFLPLQRPFNLLPFSQAGNQKSEMEKFSYLEDAPDTNSFDPKLSKHFFKLTPGTGPMNPFNRFSSTQPFH